MPSKRKRILLVGALIAAGGAAWVLLDEPAKEDEGTRVPAAFTAQNIKQKINQPGEMTRLFSSTQFRELTDEERRQVGQNKAKAYWQMFEDRVDAYFAADEREREAMLDRHLDELTAQKAQKAQKGKVDKPQQGQHPKGRKPPMSKQDRKAKSESANPDQMARMAAYKTALVSRARARGINLGGRPPK
ncbi:MAG: hypothetical protein GY778_11835 [bacterium]|nr:hypothetical protein [bacterium]